MLGLAKGAGLLLAVLVGLGAVGWLALRRGDIPYDRLEARYASADSRFVDLPGGVRMHYRDQGRPDGPVLVLVHGFGASLHTWEAWVRELGDTYRVVSLDLPGSGLTRTPEGYRLRPDTFFQTIEQFAAARGLERFTLVGSSMGGAAAWNYALAHPERLDALVLVAAAGWRDEASEGETPLIFQLLNHPVGRALLRDLDSTQLARDGLLSAFADDARVTPAMVRRYTDLSRAPGRRELILARSEPTPPATTERLVTIRTPTLVMTGEDDAIVPAAHARRFTAAIPGAALIAYDGAGHLPQEEIAERSAPDVRAFLKRGD
jgi:pimeloyl-ACP methyl ester carboxylesterase